jgi:sialate O-acetylesterase
MSFLDANISVIKASPALNISNAGVCCTACNTYNAQRNASEPECKVAVWYRGIYVGAPEALCMLKASGLKPVPHKCTASLSPPPAPPAFRFSNIYTSDMVLQSAPKQARVWGFCNAGDRVIVSFGSEKESAVNIPAVTSFFRGDHVWAVTLPATAASITASYTLSAASTMTGETLHLTHVLFGDVWVCSGQSNMAYALSGSNSGSYVHPPVNNSEAEITGMLDYQKNLRLYRVGRGGNRDSFNEVSTEVADPRDGGSNATVPGWSKPCFNGTKESCRIDFSAVCYFFGRDLYDMVSPKRPIGLIGSYVGGTPDEAWSSTDALEKCVSSRMGAGQCRSSTTHSFGTR